MQTKPCAAPYVLGQLPERGKCETERDRDQRLKCLIKEAGKNTMGILECYMLSLSFTSHSS